MAKATKPPSEGASTHRALSIAVTYPAVLSFVMGLVVLLMGLLTTAGMQRSTRGLLDQLIHQVTERMRLAVVDSLDTPYRVSGLLATDLRTGRLVARDRADLEELIPELAALGRAFPSIGSVLLATPNDDVVWVEQRADGSWKVVGFDHAGDGRAIERNLDAAGRPTAEVIASYPYAPEGRPWHRTATDGGERGAWIPLYVWATSEKIPPIGSGFAREVRDAEDRRLALIEVGFTNQGLSAQMGRISIGREGRAMIVDAAGNLVATDDPALKKSIDGRVLRALDIDDPILATVASATRDAPDTDAMNVRIVDDAGEGWEAESEPLGVAWGPDWRLVLAMPDRELLSGVRDVQGRMLLAGMLVLLGCGLLGFAVARSIVRPIIALRGTAAAIASGDLDARFSPRGGREFIELSRDLSSMTSGLRERIEMQGALEVAMEVQQNLLPQEPPQVEGLDIAATSIYSDETGGDYFDFPETDEDERAGHLAAIGDVTGHGIGAALIMASARSALRTQLRDAGGLGELLEDVNATLVEDVPMGRFMTMLLLRIEPDASGFYWASAGHDPPIVYDPVEDSFAEPDGGGVPLGVVEGERYEEYHHSFAGPGSIVVTATDGVWETVAPDGEFYGKDRLRELIHRHRDASARKIMDAVIEDTNRFRGHDRALDDVTIVVVKVT